ncbi:MAG: PilZ domain-containing protein [Candidatus Omnitrophica bacterium]|nr:PilZ domain-containing protein [Candidatus Omnitrophota bacterium]
MTNEQTFPNQPERRKFKRINKSCVVSYTPVKIGELKYDVSQTKDLSEGGLLFISDKKFEKGTILKIKLRLPEFLDYVIVQAQVVDSTQRARIVIYETRVSFIEVEQKIKDAIKRLVDYE